ncbi:alpha-E domain-containing protein [Burkholderia pyrrocinia]|uniref:alpha-E domain-containing protein n=1 Tax=Burkholderia pyrrocinia TaxID=60550 RepID=UPI0005050FA0|nr:alpha-E domain-containing protein [Burkholderia pyrrocinia]KFL53436.1 hypothetical protein JM78_13045 [Burkholderia pyrrocinia]TDA47326.1 alpha-E domain-containing protein [Burkholderia pyrrocinia]
MLSRTADHIYWMARYLERAENTARIVDINLKSLLLPQDDERQRRTLRALLRSVELEPAFTAKHGEPAPATVVAFLVADRDNPSSIVSCLRSARENARAVRGLLTTEWWETINHTWIECVEQLAADALAADPHEFLEWVKSRVHLARGVSIGTAMRDDAYYFSRLGTFLERADNVARMLDVRFLDIEQATADSPDEIDEFYYWTSILTSVSGMEIYHKVYRDVVTPDRVAELLLLNPAMPRSLRAAIDDFCMTLDKLKNGASAECEREAGRLRAELHYADIRKIRAQGLHAFLNESLERVYALGNMVSRAFMMSAS